MLKNAGIQKLDLGRKFKQVFLKLLNKGTLSASMKRWPQGLYKYNDDVKKV